MEKKIEIIARIGIFGTFLGHGTVALTDIKWIPLLTCYGFYERQAELLLPYIGMWDIIIAFIILIFPLRGAVVWAVIWAFMTALSRPISGDSFWEFIERAANWSLPLVLLIILGIPKSMKDFFTVRS